MNLEEPDILSCLCRMELRELDRIHQTESTDVSSMALFKFVLPGNVGPFPISDRQGKADEEVAPTWQLWPFPGKVTTIYTHFPFSASNPAIDRYFPTICIATSMESSLMPPSNLKVELKVPSPWFEVGRKTLRVFAACPRPLGYRRHSHDALQTLDPVRNAPCAASKTNRIWMPLVPTSHA